MFMETPNALAALATVAGLVIDVAALTHDRLERRNARKRTEREEAPQRDASEKK